MDERAVERAAERYRLLLPRSALAGRVGNLASAQVGSSLELHDFREYQPGDDLRHIDWNAVARTGRLILRVRKEEVAPRVEVLVDASRSMAVSEQKRERAREIAALVCRVCRGQGLSPALFWLGDDPRRVEGPVPADFEGRRPLMDGLPRLTLRPCGVRVLVSDLLFEGSFSTLFRRLSEGAARLALVQVLGAQDEDPEGGEGARLLDSESDAALDRLLTWDVLARYRKRLAAHQGALLDAARQARAALAKVPASEDLEQSVRTRLAGILLEPRARS